MLQSINTSPSLLSRAIFIAVLIFYSLSLTAVEIKKFTDKETNLSAWKISEGNFELELIQRSPQQTRSFFQARGFSSKIANDIATSCVFQTIVRNTESQNDVDSVTVSLKKWLLTSKDSNKQIPIKLKETWNQEWKAKDITTAARIAFRWATFPTEQDYQPGGDFNWGMISFGPRPKAVFDLYILWEQGRKTHSTWLRKMNCPADNS